MKSLYGSFRLLLAVLLLPGLSYTQTNRTINKNTKSKEVIMSTTQRNKEVIRKLYEECLNKRNMELLKDLIDESYTGIRGKKGAAGFGDPVAELIKAFPDIQYHIEDLFGEDDKVFIRWKWQGKHIAQYNAYAATNKPVTNDGMAIFQLKDGKIVASQLQTDRLGFLQQLEVLPLDLNSLAPRQKAGN